MVFWREEEGGVGVGRGKGKQGKGEGREREKKREEKGGRGMEKAEAGAVTGMGHSQGKAQSPAREKRDLRHKERGGAIGWAVILHTHTQASHTAEEKELKGTGNTGRGETGRLGSEDLLPAICLRVTDTLLLGLKSSVSSSTVGWEK